jgi:hypothetical protein
MYCPVCQKETGFTYSYSSAPIAKSYDLKCGHKLRTIYSDPITRTFPEGIACLVSQYREDAGDGLEMWEVIFEGETERVLRTILI